MTGVVVVAVGVAGFILGRTTNPTINQSPTATTGVLWLCGGRATGVVLGAGPVAPADWQTWSSYEAGDRTLIDIPDPPSGERVTITVAGVERSVPVLRCQE